MTERKAAGRPLVSVIIPTYNRSETLLRCLEAVGRQTVGASALDVIVCDDGSTDDTATAVDRDWPFSFRYLRQQNKGPGAARNAGLAVARAPLTLFLNDDTILSDDAVEHHLADHAANPDRRLLVLGSFDFVPEFRRTPLGHVLQNTSHLFQFCMLRPGCTADFNFAYTCNLSLPTQAAREVGFDEVFTGPAGEDIDFGLRLQSLGFSVLYDPRAASEHEHVMTVASLARSARTRGEGLATFAMKHPEVSGFGRTLRSAVGQREVIEREAGELVVRTTAAFESEGATVEGLPDSAFEGLYSMLRLHGVLGGLQHPKLDELLV